MNGTIEQQAHDESLGVVGTLLSRTSNRQAKDAMLLADVATTVDRDRHKQLTV